MRLVEFKVVGREESFWINPAAVRTVQTRQGGPKRQTVIRYVGLNDEVHTIVDCEIRDVIDRLSAAVPA
jgi:hypothetical protein